MTDSCKISVIVPLYNTQDYVGEAIDSILAQSHPADEIIVVDDGSTDDGVELLGRYGAALRIIRQDHAGIATAVNRGILASNGDAIAFLDADDLWARDKLRVQLPMLAADSAIDGVFAHVQQFNAGEGIANAVRPPQRGISKNTLLIRRTAFDRFGLFDETLRVSDFVPWYARAVALGLQSVVLPDVLAYRRLHATNAGVTRRNDQQQDSLIGLKQALDIRRQARRRPQS